MMTLDAALEVFVRAFASTRTQEHPYVVERIDGVWVMRDGPGKKRDPRNEEWVGTGLSPAELDSIARKHARGRFALAYVVQSHAAELDARKEFKALEYRLRTVEPLFVHPLQQVPEAVSGASVLKVEDEPMAERLCKELRRKSLSLEFSGPDAPLRQYVAELDGELVGWVSSIQVHDAAWCANLYVKPDHRRQGIAKALMVRMLQDDRTLGRSASVLLSSRAGAHLYPTLGYREIGTLLLFTH